MTASSNASSVGLQLGSDSQICSAAVVASPGLPVPQDAAALSWADLSSDSPLVVAVPVPNLTLDQLFSSLVPKTTALSLRQIVSYPSAIAAHYTALLRANAMLGQPTAVSGDLTVVVVHASAAYSGSQYLFQSGAFSLFPSREHGQVVETGLFHHTGPLDDLPLALIGNDFFPSGPSRYLLSGPAVSPALLQMLSANVPQPVELVAPLSAVAHGAAWLARGFLQMPSRLPFPIETVIDGRITPVLGSVNLPPEAFKITF